MHSFREITQQSASPNRGSPGRLVHLELLKMLHVDNYTAIDTSQAYSLH